MEVGSLVILENGNFGDLPILYPDIRFPKEKGLYVIESIEETFMGIGVKLEEIDNTHRTINGMIPSFLITRFREVQPPMEVSHLVEESILELV